jgi:hypothetical protein
MIPYLKNFKYIAFQKYVPGKTLEKNEIPPYSQDFYKKAKNLFREFLPEVEIIERF